MWRVALVSKIHHCLVFLCCSVIWEPMGDGKRVISLADNHALLWDLQESSTQATVRCSHAHTHTGSLQSSLTYELRLGDMFSNSLPHTHTHLHTQTVLRCSQVSLFDNHPIFCSYRTCTPSLTGLAKINLYHSQDLRANSHAHTVIGQVSTSQPFLSIHRVTERASVAVF